MTARAATPADATGTYFISVERLRLGLLWLTGFSSGIVLFEPAPYEFLVAVTIGVFALTGLKIRAAHVPLLVLLLAIIITYMTSVLPVANRDHTVKWAIVSCFLAATSIFFAMALVENTKARLDSIIAGYIAGAVVVALIGILAWFGKLPFQDTLLINGRARSTFKDANVFGPFLILPIMVVAVKVLTGHYRSLIVNGGIAGILCLALLLSFSRGAWGHFVGSVVIMIVLCFLTAPTLKERARVTAFAIVGIAGAAVLLVLLLSVDAIGALFQERASLVQS
ncbi:MAG TPA: O-antigen ligase domain-containing protein, partial [Xanthobacteraceae bacterium]|nr:O-antigen ligase domain-containing protein [Xanthobacteraceae bacterium]